MCVDMCVAMNVGMCRGAAARPRRRSIGEGVPDHVVALGGDELALELGVEIAEQVRLALDAAVHRPLVVVELVYPRLAGYVWVLMEHLR